MADIAVGTKVFTRSEKLGDLLESLTATPVDVVYIADDGPETDEKTELYRREYPFETIVLDLEYDSGLGYGRRQIVEEMDEEYLLIVDTDHEVPANMTILRDQLEARPDIGGIAGTLLEPGQGRMFQSAKDFTEEGDVLVRSADLEEKTVETVAGHAFVEFDFIPNAAMFRYECLTDYCWDPEYVIGKEHVDFYVGHWKSTDWTFGVAPEVFFRHYPGGDDSYESNRFSESKLDQSAQHFREKWGYSYVRTDRGYWFDTEPIDNPSLAQRGWRVLRNQGPITLLWKSIRKSPRLIRRLGR